ncbi:Ig-like domain-containing protein [Pseudolysobacter antarcticus]|uniref:Ig-like domain-containing protein n=1 Tax=Pseudolysobacter antarcticus TaxID=2511995 RepID=UPI00101EC393|nr:Ig-like domain-containing protein [Pseudolysobacter antarcticus]
MAFLILCVASNLACADVRNPNPNLTISIIGSDSFNVSAPGVEIPAIFSVRVVDPQGNPIPGLTVEFFTNYSICFAGDPRCVLPPQAMYGHFSDNQSGESVLTDQNGVASAGHTYIGGSVAGTYTVVGGIYYSASAYNAEIMKTGSDPTAFFSINQFAAAPIASIPASGTFGLLLLALAILVATACLKRVF